MYNIDKVDICDISFILDGVLYVFMDFWGLEECMNGMFIFIVLFVVNGYWIYMLMVFCFDNNVNIIFYCILNLFVSCFFYNLYSEIKIV